MLSDSSVRLNQPLVQVRDPVARECASAPDPDATSIERVAHIRVQQTTRPLMEPGLEVIDGLGPKLPTRQRRRDRRRC
jgi:hypothetical protein